MFYFYFYFYMILNFIIGVVEFIYKRFLESKLIISEYSSE